MKHDAQRRKERLTQGVRVTSVTCSGGAGYVTGTLINTRVNDVFN